MGRACRLCRLCGGTESCRVAPGGQLKLAKMAHPVKFSILSGTPTSEAREGLQGLAAGEAAENWRMLITCSNCQAKIKVPDSAAGKKGKCPKCGTVMTIPAAEAPAAEAVAPEAVVPARPRPASAVEVSAKKPPPPPPPPELQHEPVEQDYVEEGELPRPPGKSPLTDDEIEDEEYDGHDEVEYQDDDDRPRRKKKKIRMGQPSIGMSLTSMILGIVSVVAGTGGCCCIPIGVWTSPLPFLLGGGAVGLGIFGLKQGGTGFAITGLVCGGVGLLEALVCIGLFIFGAGMNVLSMLG
jgi:predicted Zn finger-like uncharacterized protein